MKIVVQENEENVRLDTYISNNTDYSRTKISKLIKEQKVFVNNKPTPSNDKVKQKDIIEFALPEEEKIDIKVLNKQIKEIVEKEDIMRKELDKIIAELESDSNE